jgi:hypothetical protein
MVIWWKYLFLHMQMDKQDLLKLFQNRHRGD